MKFGTFEKTALAYLLGILTGIVYFIFVSNIHAPLIKKGIYAKSLIEECENLKPEDKQCELTTVVQDGKPKQE